MTDPIPFLTSLGQVLATQALYGDGHPALGRAMEVSYGELQELTSADPRPQFSFLGGETVYQRRVLRALKDWDWAARFASAGIERIEIIDVVTREQYHEFLADIYGRLNNAMPDSAEARQVGARSSIRFGAVRVTDGDLPSDTPLTELATITYSLAEEVDSVRWLHERVAEIGELPLVETETVVRSLALAMHGERRMILPLLQLKEFDQYTTTHSCNVSVLSMALAEASGMGPREVRAVGVAGMLHDLGKVRIPKDILVKPGAFTEAEHKVMQQHPVEGARLILDQHQHLDLAAVVAYEHHIMINGQGYPSLRFARGAHYVSALVHICDVYDALCTDRPYRDAWAPEAAIALIEEQAGTSFDPELTRLFSRMVRDSTLQRLPVDLPQVEAKPEPEGGTIDLGDILREEM